MNDNSKSNYDKFNWWLKNNKVTASLIAFGVIVIALSTFTDAARNLLGLIDLEKRPAINGIWNAEVTYDWPNANYIETFVFDGEDEVLWGTASFLKIDRVILEGKVSEDQIQFITKTKENSSWDEGNSAETIHHYVGLFEDGQLHFTMQTEGGYSTHLPIKFSAKKVSDKED
jgi:hypothetical protein